jgi:hypothetical protein
MLKTSAGFFIKFSLLITGIYFFSCERRNENKENLLVGSWEAVWETDSAGFPEQVNRNDCRMRGKVAFSSDGLAEIRAYGFEGCVFMTDTMTNSLQWKVNGDTLHLLSEGDSYGLPYRINYVTNDQMQLQLLEDIKLTLQKEL